MKKIYFTLGLGVLFLGANAQQANKINQPLTKSNASKVLTTKVKTSANKFSAVANATQTAKTINQSASTMSVIWSDDFSSAATWTLTPGAGTTANWSIGTGPGTGSFAIGAIQSTSAANGYAIFDSDADCSGNQIANMTNVTPINLTGHTHVRLKFQQYYRRDADSTRIYVSNDGTTWTNFPINEQYMANDISTNPEVVGVDISSVAGNQATVWVRFTYYSPTSASTWPANYGPDNGCGYNWLVDDASIEDIFPSDLTALAAYSGSSCGLTVGGVELVFKNNGFNPATNFPLKYISNGGTPVVETYTGTANPGDVVTYIFNTPITVAPGTPYFVTAYADIASDGNLADDTAKTAFTGSPFNIPYYTGFEQPAGPLGFSSQQVSGTGNSWTIDNNIYHTGAQDALLLTGVAGASDDWLFTPCLNFTVGHTYQVKYYHSCFKTTTIPGAGSIGVFLGTKDSASYMTTTVKAATALTAVTYSTNFATTYKADSATFVVPSTGTYVLGFEGTNALPTKQAFISIDDINVTDLGFTGIKTLTNSADLAIYPNPTTGLLNVTTTAATATIEIFNVIGQSVMTKSLTNGANTIDISNLSNGVYSIQIKQNNTLTVGKVIKTN
ncbi:MAG TPA: T9SS type A sorting domain-containing protein [Bacteroidia bacterium]|nr:T9SS type A sorting domain-containing protein [Bacteroidia bacterium]